MQEVFYKDLGLMDYEAAWGYQEALLQENVRIKREARQLAEAGAATIHHLLLVEHRYIRWARAGIWRMY